MHSFWAGSMSSKIAMFPFCLFFLKNIYFFLMMIRMGKEPLLQLILKRNTRFRYIKKSESLNEKPKTEEIGEF